MVALAVAAPALPYKHDAPVPAIYEYRTALLVMRGLIFARSLKSSENLRNLQFLGCYWASLPSSGCLWKLLLLLLVLLLEDGCKHTVLQEFAPNTAAALPSYLSPAEA